MEVIFFPFLYHDAAIESLIDEKGVFDNYLQYIKKVLWEEDGSQTMWLPKTYQLALLVCKAFVRQNSVCSLSMYS